MICAPASGRPRWSSIIDADHMAPSRLASPLPAMSGAGPCTGSNTDGYSRSGSVPAPGARHVVVAARESVPPPQRQDRVLQEAPGVGAVVL